MAEVQVRCPARRTCLDADLEAITSAAAEGQHHLVKLVSFEAVIEKIGRRIWQLGDFAEPRREIPAKRFRERVGGPEIGVAAEGEVFERHRFIRFLNWPTIASWSEWHNLAACRNARDFDPNHQEFRMTTDRYRISSSNSGTHVGEFFDQHYQMNADHWRQDRIEDLVTPITFATHYLVDATAPILANAALGNAVDITLPSGWKVSSLDLDRVWRRFLVFTNPVDPADGYILACDLSMEESDTAKAARGQSQESGRDMLRRIWAAGDEKRNLREGNRVTDVYMPENSKGIDKVALFRFEPHPDWASYTRGQLEGDLRKGEYAHEVFEHRPQRHRTDSALDFSSVGRGLNPRASLDAMPILAEFASQFDPTAFSKRMEEHFHGMYATLEFRQWPILQSARGTFEHTSQFPGPAFTRMIEDMWKRGAAIDVASRMDMVVELTDRLIELGHVSSELEYDCNDGRTRVYARETAKGIRGLYVEYEDEATAFWTKEGDGRVIVDNSEYAFGTTKSSVLDMIVDGREVAGVASICGYDEKTAGVLRRALVDVESAHCHLVPDRKATPASKRPKKR